MINDLYKHEVAVKIKEANVERSDKTTQEKAKAPPGVFGGSARRRGERLIGLDWILPSSDLYAQPICHRW